MPRLAHIAVCAGIMLSIRWVLAAGYDSIAGLTGFSLLSAGSCSLLIGCMPFDHSCLDEKKRKEKKFTLFSDHNGSLQRRQPGAMTIGHSPNCLDGTLTTLACPMNRLWELHTCLILHVLTGQQ